MIKVKTNNGETDLSILGDLSDVCADTVAIVHAIRNSLTEHDPLVGELYEKAMKAKLIDLAFDTEAKKEETKTDESKADETPEKGKESESVEDTLKKIGVLIAELLK